jgi:cellulose synthase/poly-beta-1,6-N-acetylglucosamine synthase-like glycosyltransferase
MKISVIHNTFRDNPFIRESVILNLKALKEANVDYQYIVFNDNGDTEIEDQVKDLDVEYYYSDYNFGMKQCSGGWIGAIPLLKGDLVHNTGQDDVFTPQFYKNVVDTFKSTNCDLVYCNGFKSYEDLAITGETMGPISDVDYSNPRLVFNQWFGVVNNKITRTNNFIPAPGTVYKVSLHDEIGKPALEEFAGVCDFEYWARILFYNKQVKYISTPCWMYRMSKYTTTLEVIDGKVNERDLAAGYLEKMKVKYQNLLDNE